MIKETAKKMKLAAPFLAASAIEARNEALGKIKAALLANREAIFAANSRDMKRAEEDDVPPQVRKRLKFGPEKLNDVCAGLEQLISLPDPVGKVQLKRELDEGLVLSRVTCPIGVIGVIFEARPDALVQISGLCLKSGNCAILKGGSETRETNRVLFETIHAAVTEAGLPKDCIFQAQERSEINEMLSCDEDIDLLIPRGSNQFVRYIMDHTRIPVMGHAEGVCHIYVDASYQKEMALHILEDAKTQYPVACNTVEMLLVNRSIAPDFLPAVKERMDACGVRLYGTEEVNALISCDGIIREQDFHKEYGDLALSVALVADVKEAAAHVNRYGSHHTDCIITEDDEAAAYYMQMVDSAGVYRNCSTRFADGFRYGFGAEVGIGTGKLHARGPVGLEGLVTYRYCLEGHGHIVGDYASGKASFHFKDLA